MEAILQIPALFFSIIIHEFMRGYAAYIKGDDTAYLSGRLTLNPIPHIDPVGTLILPALAYFSHMPFIGWAKPVPVNPYRMRDPRYDMVFVAASGPASNLALAFLSAVSLKILSLVGFFYFSFSTPFYYLLTFMVYINIALAFFNLIPIYPLDGSQILLGLLPYKALQIYERHIPYGFYIIIFLALAGIFKYIIVYPMEIVLKLFSLMGLAV
ncbi:MAG: site-2 protease family protein [Elusimicrobia bacterium]|nr:site-2 protease family protein [Elusimicrobiota bacterium]